jgi:hypothetical protein
MECSFVGSNAVIERGSYVGFGCFVQGKLGPGAGLLPFTLSPNGEPARDQIGAVLSALAGVVITHFVNWTFQAVGPEGVTAVAQMIPQAIRRGQEAIHAELARRAGSAPPGKDPDACYRTLPQYAEAQLRSGLANYRWALESGAWEIAYRHGQLWFSSDRGGWRVRDGTAFWQKH